MRKVNERIEKLLQSTTQSIQKRDEGKAVEIKKILNEKLNDRAIKIFIRERVQFSGNTDALTVIT